VRRWLLVLCACRASAAVDPAATGPVRTATVQRGSIVDRLVLTGEIHAQSSAELVVPRTDQLPLAIRWMADDGAAVKAGDKVLEFDNSAFTKSLEDTRLALLESEMTLSVAKDLARMETETKTTELAQRQIALDKATARASVPADLMSGREAQDRALEKRRAEVALTKASQALAAQKDVAALELRVKQIDLDKTRGTIAAAEQTIKDLVLTAPRDGVIVVELHPWEGRKFHSGDTVQAGMTIITIPDLQQPMDVRAELSDVDDGRVTVGATGTCTLDAFPTAPVACSVTGLTPVARTKGQGSLRRAFSAVLSLATTDATRMRPGMSVKVELGRAPSADVLVVPRSAVVFEGATSRVHLAHGEPRDIKLGACDAQRCAIDSGLSVGDVVALGGGA